MGEWLCAPLPPAHSNTFFLGWGGYVRGEEGEKKRRGEKGKGKGGSVNWNQLRMLISYHKNNGPAQWQFYLQTFSECSQTLLYLTRGTSRNKRLDRWKLVVTYRN